MSDRNPIHTGNKRGDRPIRKRITRSHFLNGAKPKGFVFSLRTNRYKFHIIENDTYSWCGRDITKTNKISPYILVESISHLYKHKDFQEFMLSTKLCTICENNFIGLHRKERILSTTNHIPIFNTYDDTLTIDKHLLFILQNPQFKEYPKLKPRHLQNAIFI